MTEPNGTRPFSPFEWMLSLRYLRARRKEGFISVIAGFSFLGIVLGVATLIIVMAVMNGFRHELLGKILGLNGHLLIQPLEKPLTDWQEVSARIAKAPGIKLAAPIVEGQALASSPFNSGGVLVRGIRLEDLEKLPSIAKNIKQGTLKGFDERGFAFYTNLESRKGLELAGNPQVSLNFYWRELGRQVEIRGTAERVSDGEADVYFASRPRGSQLGAWASRQSRPMASRAELMAAVAKIEARYLGRAIPRPSHWSGFRVVPSSFEFWVAGTFRLHKRTLFERSSDGWRSRLLFP